MMSKSKVENILADIEYYKDYDLNKLIEERLDKTLALYAEELDAANNRLKYKKIISVMRGLNR